MGFNDSMMGIVGLGRHISDGFREGEDKRQRNALAQLAGDYYAAPSQNRLANLARAGGDVSQASQYGQQQEQRQRELATQHALLLDGMPDDNMRAQAWPSVRQQLIAGGIDPQFLPNDYDQRVGGMIKQLVGGKPQQPMNVGPGAAIYDPNTHRELYRNPAVPQRPVYDATRGGWVMPMDMGEGGPQGGGFVSVAGPKPMEAGESERLAIERERLRIAQAAEARDAARPIPPSEEEKLRMANDAKMAAANAEQQRATDPLVGNALDFALRTTNMTEKQFIAASGNATAKSMRDLSADEVASVVENNGNARWLDGAAVAEVPFFGPMIQRVTQGDIDSNAAASASKQARIDNPTGPVSNADVQGARAGLWGPEKTAAANAAALRRTLEQAERTRRAAAPTASASPAAPASGPKVGDRQRNKQTGVVREWNGRQWVSVQQ